MNTEKMLWLADQLAEMPPEAVRMETYVGPRRDGCGTAGCIAGWAAMLSSDAEGRAYLEEHATSQRVWEEARGLLDLDREKAYALFMPWRAWAPALYATAAECTVSVQARDLYTRDDAVRALRTMAATGAPEWPTRAELLLRKVSA